MPISLIAMDVDGTLLNSAGRLTDAVCDAVAEAAEAGVVVALATGRDLDECRPIFEKLPQIDSVISCTGASVVHAGVQVYENPLPMQTVREVCRRLVPLCCQVELMAEGHVYADRQAMQEVPRFLNQYYRELIPRTRVPVDLQALLQSREKPVTKVQMFFCSAQDQRQAQALLADLGLQMVYSIPQNLELNMPGVSKGIGLEKLAAYLNIPKGETMAIGDNLNDLQMLQQAGYGVAMGNSNPEVLPYAGYKTASCDEDGVAVAIRCALRGKMEQLRRR